MSEYLESWLDSEAKNAIVSFVEAVTDSESDEFAPIEDRVATFDNDGTLWSEKPLAQGVFIAERLAEAALADESLRGSEPWASLAAGDASWIDNAIVKHYSGDQADLQLLAGAVLSAFGDIGVEEFEQQSAEFLARGLNPIHERPFTELGFVPMVELLAYLEAHQFTCYIVSGGGRDFMRPVTASMYGIPRERVVGSSSGLAFVSDADGARVVRTATLGILDDGPTKATQIWERIGRRPLLAAGNANGDVPMLELATSQPRRTLGLLVSHDDDAREVAYAEGAERAFETAATRGWTAISMANHWSRVFAHDV
ncbi:haloacid dehalogenase-like hydrolase [Demequina aurantiaca]|uniref:haloacid dehalogenase-like hydrolase n=1 Tax=Demequina aurantiaca TaxID=676200 RepID=UPI003D3316C8